MSLEWDGNWHTYGIFISCLQSLHKYSYIKSIWLLLSATNIIMFYTAKVSSRNTFVVFTIFTLSWIFPWIMSSSASNIGLLAFHKSSSVNNHFHLDWHTSFSTWKVYHIAIATVDYLYSIWLHIHDYILSQYRGRSNEKHNYKAVNIKFSAH